MHHSNGDPLHAAESNRPDTVMPATPQPRPRPAKPGLLKMLLFAAIGAALGFLAARHGPELSLVRARLSSLSGWDLLSLPLLALLVFGVHELGHVLGGLHRGMRFLLLVIGPLQWSRGSDGIHFRWAFNLGALGGVAACMPDPERPAMPQLRSLVLGGPLASLLFALVCTGVAWLGEERLHAYALILAALSFASFAVTAIPVRAGGFMSDGMQYLELLRGGRGVEQRTLLTTLMAQSMTGVRPANLDARQLDDALAMVQPDPLRAVAARLYAFLYSWDGGDIEQARAHADWLGDHVDDYPDGFRQALTIELALFAAFACAAPDTARDWLQRSRGGVVDGSRRALAEASLAMREARTAEAERQLAVAERELPRAMDRGLALFSHSQIVALRALLLERATPV